MATVYPHRDLDHRDLERLSTCHEDLVRLVLDVAELYPLRVVEGHRGMADQERAVAEHRSRVHWPHSRHNSSPSEAVDLAPMLPDGPDSTRWLIPWGDLRPWRVLAEIVKARAMALEIAVSWGGDWEHLVDMPHWELRR